MGDVVLIYLICFIDNNILTIKNYLAFIFLYSELEHTLMV